jgi:hypothetical protein
MQLPMLFPAATHVRGGDAPACNQQPSSDDAAGRFFGVVALSLAAVGG